MYFLKTRRKNMHHESIVKCFTAHVRRVQMIRLFETLYLCCLKFNHVTGTKAHKLFIHSVIYIFHSSALPTWYSDQKIISAFSSVNI